MTNELKQALDMIAALPPSEYQTAPPVAAPQAAGAVSIDSPEFQNAVSKYLFERDLQDLADYFNAHAAQRYEAGAHAQHQIEAEAGNTLQAAQYEQRQRAEKAEAEVLALYDRQREDGNRIQKAEASLARLVAGDAKEIEDIWDTAKEEAATYVETHCVDGEFHARAILSAARPTVSAILPAKAENGWHGPEHAIPSDEATPAPATDDHSDGYIATSELTGVARERLDRMTPKAQFAAMGEELPPPVKQAFNNLRMFRAGECSFFSTDFDIVDNFIKHTYGRACMALRQPGAEKVGDMPESQEPKYGIRDNRLYNRVSGEFIPLDEPVFIFRARDAHAVNVLAGYARDVSNSDHAKAVWGRVDDFKRFWVQYPDRMKQPDTATAPVSQPAAQEQFQYRVLPWMAACFGPRISADTTERNHRFLEEALELVQACGCTQDEAHQLVDYVYGRPVGEIQQEVGGVMVTLAALCLAQCVDMHECGDTELARIWTKVEQIRAKQAAKPKHSPLPAAPPPPPSPRQREVSRK